MLGVKLYVLFLLGVYSPASCMDTVVAVYDSTEGDAQKEAYSLAWKDFNSSGVELVHLQCQAEMKEPSFPANERVVVVGFCPHVQLPQVVCSKRAQLQHENVINILRTPLSLYAAVKDLLSFLKIVHVSIMSLTNNTQPVGLLSQQLLADGLVVSLQKGTNHITDSQVVIAWNPGDACLVSRDKLTLLLGLDSELSSLSTCQQRSNIYTLSWQLSNTHLQSMKKFNDSLNANLTVDMSSLETSWCYYKSMGVALQAMADTLTQKQLVDQLHTQQKELTLKGTKQAPDAVVIRRYDLLTDIVAVWSHNMGLNVTGSIKFANSSKPNENEYEVQLVTFGIFSALAAVGVVYSSALIAFNCAKSKDRTIKLTSPNINIIVCTGGLLSLLAVPLLGIQLPVSNDLSLLGNLQQAGIFMANVGATIMHSSILVKTWRVHRIFKKMHLSSKGTKDEHLILMVLMLTLIDVSINAFWAKLDAITCTDALHPGALTSEDIVCSSKNQQVWSCVLMCYKIIIILFTLFYAWHVRHVKLPSLQDSQFIFANSLVNIGVMLAALPALASSWTIQTTRYSTSSLSSLCSVISTLSLLLAPKVCLVTSKNGTKANSAVKFLFGESLKKQKDREENPKGCWAGLKSCQSQSGSSMGDSILSQEIETLKQLVKEKDDTIRELTDRLFFGADKFQAYVNGKTSSYRRSTSSPAVSTITEHDVQPQRMRSRQQRFIQKPQCSPVSSVDSGNVDDMCPAHSQSRTQPNHYSNENSLRDKAHKLSPIREQSTSDLANHQKRNYYIEERCATPTTDSAINMSRSDCSSDDESKEVTLSMNRMANRVRQLLWQQPSNEHTGVGQTPALIGERLAAISNRRQSTNQYSAHSVQDLSPAPQVELELTFPVSECL